MAIQGYYDVLSSFGDYKWVNNWLVIAPDLDTMATDAHLVSDAHVATLNSFCKVEKVITSLHPDPTKVNFHEFIVNANGALAVTTADSDPATIVTWLDLQAAIGRPGKKFLRFAGSKQGWTADGQGMTINNFSGTDLTIAGPFRNMMNQLAGDGIHLQVSRVHTRPVSNIVLHGMTTLPTNHKYFDTKKPG